MVPTASAGHHRDMTQTPPDAPGPGTQDSGPRVSAEQMRDLGRLRRSITDRKVAGVAGGLGRHLDIDPTLLRVAFVVLIFFGGAGLLLYAAGWLLVPEDGRPEGAIASSTGTRTTALIVVGVVAALLALGDSWGALGSGWGFPWPLLVVGLVVALVLVNRDRRSGPPAGPQPPPTVPQPPGSTTPTRPVAPAAAWSDQQHAQGYYQQPSERPTATMPKGPAPDRGPVLFWPTVALIALALGALGLYEAAGNVVVNAAYPALALTVVGMMLVAGAWLGRTGGLVFLGVVAAVLMTLASIVSDFSVGRFERTPDTAAELQDEYSMAAGRMEIDLSRIDDVEALDGRAVDVSATAGEVIVTLPDDLDVDLTVEVNGAGEAEVLDQRRDGDNLVVHRSIEGGPGAPQLDLDIDVLFGRVEVRN